MCVEDGLKRGERAAVRRLQVQERAAATSEVDQMEVRSSRTAAVVWYRNVELCPHLLLSSFAPSPSRSPALPLASVELLRSALAFLPPSLPSSSVFHVIHCSDAPNSDHAGACFMISPHPLHHVRRLLLLPRFHHVSIRSRRPLHSTSYVLPLSSRLSAPRPPLPFGEQLRTPRPLRPPRVSEPDTDGRERGMREWRRERQRAADENVLLTPHNRTAEEDTANSGAARSFPTSLLSPEPLSVVSDPDTRYQTDEDSTRASLMAFAELEGKLRARQALRGVDKGTPVISGAAGSTTQTAVTSPAPTPSPPTSSTDDELMASSMDAFAALELQLAKKRLQKKQDYLDDPTARTTQQTVTTAGQPPIQLTALTPPRMPEAQECCGMSCPNCVSTHATATHSLCRD